MAKIKSTLETTRCSRCGINYAPESVSSTIDYTRTLCRKCKALFNEEVTLLNKFYIIPPVMVEGVKKMLLGLKEIYPDLDLDGGHLKQTPTRVARMFIELCSGLGQNPEEHIRTAFEESDYKGIVLTTNIQFTSLCMHHMAVFRGKAHVGYIPDGKIVGLSKLNRVVEILAARPQVQEQLTYQIAHIIHDNLKPKGTAVIIQAGHDCISVRGVKSKGSITKTSEMLGIFLDNKNNCKDELMQLIGEV